MAIRVAMTGLALLAASQAWAQEDRIFASGIEPGLAIHGRAYWPDGLARAVVVAHVGAHTASTSAGADGRYGLVVEYRHIQGTPLVQLQAGGIGSQANIRYVGQLGRIDRLLDAAGEAGVLTVAEEAFVNLTPYSTAVSAYLWAHAGFGPVSSQDEFERAIRSQQLDHVHELATAVALVAQGALPLPAGSDDTWQTLSSLAGSQRLYGDYKDLLWSVSCLSQPGHPVCNLEALRTDPVILPPAQPVAGQIYLTSDGGFDHFAGRVGDAFVVDDDGAAFQSMMDMSPTLATVDVDVQGDGRYRLHHQDGSPLQVSQNYPIIDGQQVLELREILDVRLRFSHTAGNLVFAAATNRTRLWYPDNPEIPEVIREPAMPWPHIVTGNPLPAAQRPDLAPLAHGRWLMTLPLGTVMISLDADIHAFGSTGGSTERGGHAFTLLGQEADRFTLDYGDRIVQVRLLNQDQPGIWRTALTITRGSDTTAASGILMQVDAPQPAWTAGTVPGLYRSRVNGQWCDGPYADLELHFSQGICIGSREWFGFQLDPGGTGIQDPNNTGVPVQWSLPGGANPGRLHINRYAGATLTASRGWEVVKQVGNRYWVLENLPLGVVAGPAEFAPSNRVLAYDRQ